MNDEGGGRPRVLASGATELWADGVRPGDRLAGLGEAAMHIERPLHLAAPSSDRTWCGLPVTDLREYPVDFAAQADALRCPTCARAFEESAEGGSGVPD